MAWSDMTRCGQVRIVITRAGFIVGHGTGTLHFQGKRYPLRVSGVNFGPLGATRVDLLGRAYHMRTAGSIHGIYSSVQGGGCAYPDDAVPGSSGPPEWYRPPRAGTMFPVNCST
jgi:hypothetical protein